MIDPLPLPTDSERAANALAAFSEAALAIAGELSAENVLQQIVDSARVLAGARYAALGIPNKDSLLEDFIVSGMDEDEIGKMANWPRGMGLLGALLKGGTPIRIPKIGDDPRAAGFPENHPPMESFMGVPIYSADEVLGNLYLTEKIDGDKFTEQDQALIEVLAAHAATAIKNARLYNQVARLAVAEERNRIGMDLHDGTIQSIFAVGLTLEAARLALQDKNTTDADTLLDGAITGLNNVIRDIRNFILDLRPQRFEGNLGDGLARLVREFQVNSDVPVELDAPLAAVIDIPSIIGRTLFLTTQEALANVARHAVADSVIVRVRRNKHEISLAVIDDGKGFDPADGNRPLGHGLANMRTRAEDLGGRFRLKAGHNAGTTVELTLPLKPTS